MGGRALSLLLWYVGIRHVFVGNVAIIYPKQVHKMLEQRTVVGCGLQRSVDEM